MKKVLLTLVTVALILTCVFAFVACAKPEVDQTDNTGFGEGKPNAAIVGNKIKGITKDMSGTDMMVIANNNYALCDYAAVWQIGNVDTTVLGLKITQAVEGLRIRKAGNTFMYNNSYTAKGALPVDIRVMENYYVDGADNSVKLLSAGESGNVTVVDGKLKATKWALDKSYATKDEYLVDNPNDPSRLSMYVINKDTIVETTAPVFNAEGGFYTFDVTCNANEAFKEYIPVMKYMLDQSVKGAQIKDKGQTLTFKVEIWENGLFKRYIVEEGYGMNIAKIINGNIKLISEVKFSYDDKQEPFEKYYNNNDFVCRNDLAPAGK